MFENIASNPDALAILAAGGSAAGAMAAPTTRVPVSPLYSLASGLAAGEQAIPGAIAQQQALESGKMNLQLQRAAQPGMLAMYGSMNPSAGAVQPGGTQGGAPGSPPGGAMNPMAQRALQFAIMSRDPKTMASTATSIYENDPSTVAAKEREKIVQMPDGTYRRAGDLVSGSGSPLGVPPMPGASSAPPVAPPVRTPQIMPNGQPDNVDVPPQNLDDLMDKATPPKAADGKPIIPGMTNLFQPDPSGNPKYNTPNTTQGVKMAEENATEDNKANLSMTSSITSLKDEQFRLNELADIYKGFQSGTFTALNPELVSKLQSLGVVSNPSTLKTLGDAQAATETHIMQVLKQIKDANATMEGAPTRTFSSEVSELLDQGPSVKMQPAALYNTLAQAKGVVDYHADMINGWNKIGGLGNRINNGSTLRPNDYARQFTLSHNIEDYKKAVQDQWGPFKGMTPPANRPPLISFMGQ